MKRSGGSTTILGRGVLTILTLAGTYALLRIGPFVAPAVEARDASAERAARDAGGGPGRQTAAAGPWHSLPVPDPAGPLAFEGLPVGLRYSAVTPCDSLTWEPADAGLCAAGCNRPTVAREPGSATFGWRRVEDGVQTVHGAFLQCDPAGHGQLLHLWAPEGLAGVPASRDAATPRRTFFPPQPGVRQVGHLRGAGWSLIVDRPRGAALALERQELEMRTRGWRSAALGAAREPGTRLYQRGSQICFVSRGGASEELLVAACTGLDPKRETMR